MGELHHIFALVRSIRQGSPISPFLFVIDTHPLLVMLSRLATNNVIMDLQLPSGRQLVAQVLVDDFHASTSLT